MNTLNTVNITIDGRQMAVSPDLNILECALQNGIYIPHLCHHKDLTPAGVCRMCVVEVEGDDVIRSACMLQPEEGMVITTKSGKLDKLRRLALELLLTCHPEDCSTCPKYGNCELQTLIQYIGPKTGRLKSRSKGFSPVLDNPLLVHDMNRCIGCGRCVRACNELRGARVIQFQKKDMETYVAALHDRLLMDADCRFCTACAEVCPTGAIRDKLEEAGAKRKAVPCREECPIHTDIPRYVRFIREGNYDAAAAVIREKAPFPKSLGYICTHPCELACRRQELSDPISIRNLKRAAAENDTGRYWKGTGKQLPDTGRKVCVVGGGPAGLTAAYYLRKQGHDVTIKEALPACGGMMAWGIPAYRLPKEIVAEEVKIIEDQGVHIELNARVDNPEDLLLEYDAVLMAIGTHQGVRLPMEGSDLPGVLLNTDFLRHTLLKNPTGMGKKVIVLGGGNVAFDCARSAIRHGAEEVHLACLESRENMTADEEEIEQAIEEGVQVHPGRTFEAITGTDHADGVDFMKVKSFTFDENRRAMIEKEENSLHHIEADTVIFATGQRPAIQPGNHLKLGRASSIAVADTESDLSASVEGIFACGDCIYGTKSVAAAIASGRTAASQIDRYLGQDGDISEMLAPIQHPDPWIGQEAGFGACRRTGSEVDPASIRKNTFDLYDHGIDPTMVCQEANRCLQCDLRQQISRPRLWGDYEQEPAAA